MDDDENLHSARAGFICPAVSGKIPQLGYIKSDVRAVLVRFLTLAGEVIAPRS